MMQGGDRQTRREEQGQPDRGQISDNLIHSSNTFPRMEYNGVTPGKRFENLNRLVMN